MVNSAILSHLESFGSLSFSTNDISPQSTTHWSLDSEHSKIFTKLMSLPASIWAFNCEVIAAAGGKNGTPGETVGTAEFNVLGRNGEPSCVCEVLASFTCRSGSGAANKEEGTAMLCR